MFAAMLGVKKQEKAAEAPNRRRQDAPAPERTEASPMDALAVQKLVVEEMAVEKAELEESYSALESELTQARAALAAARASLTAYACERFWHEARIGELVADVDELRETVGRMRADNDELEEKLARMGRRLAESRRVSRSERD